jgi:putative ABC transport system permease protein
VDFNYLETLRIQILKGRSFSRNYGEERGNLIVNQMFENLLGVESSIGEVIHIGDTYEGTIIGVMKDFHQTSASEAFIRPLIVFLNPSLNYIILRIDPANISATLEKMESTWKNIAPHIPFKFSFLDEDFDSLFQDIQNFGTTVKYLTMIAVFIACLGLFGLTSFSAEKRTKEIGIRKVLGARMSEIVYLLGQDFIKIVILANLLSVPITWYIMKKWLNGYPYHVNLGWGIFVQSGLLILGVTVITVIYQMIKASLANPVDSLKHE